MKKLWLLAIVAITGCGDTATYYKCPSCGAAYKQEWYQGGLPGQCRYECRNCDAKLRKSSKEESGWIDGQEPDVEGK